MTNYYDEPPLQWWDWDADNDGDWDDDDNDEETTTTPEPEPGTEPRSLPHRDDAGSGGERDEVSPRRPLGD